MIFFLAVLSAVAVAADAPAVRLAPGPSDLARAIGAASDELSRAQAVDTALTRIHNRLAAEGAATAGRSACEVPEIVALSARTEPLGEAWRTSVQRARNALGEAESYANAPTLAPLVDRAQGEALVRLGAAVDREQRRYLEARAWQSRYLVPWMRRCPATLATAPGLALGTVPASGEPAWPPVAVLGVGGGRVCPADVPADGGVVVLDNGRGCYGATSCDCAPIAVWPGAVLGP